MTVELFLFVMSVVGLGIGLRSFFKLKRQNYLILIQSQEIKKQLKELEQQNQQLQELFQERQQLIGVVSHDLKGPFNRIFALIQLIRLSGKNLTDEQLEYLAKMHQISADGLSMVRNLLDNRRLESKGIDLTREPLHLTPFINSLLKGYHALAENKKIELLFEKKGDLIIDADKMYLSRVLENLLSNAMKFSPAGKRVTVSVKENADSVEVSIQDEGPGISPEDQKKLFQKFQTLTAKPTGGESSTGLGLSIVKAIMERMGGEVTCSSELGKGSTFTIRLPK